MALLFLELFNILNECLVAFLPSLFDQPLLALAHPDDAADLLSKAAIYDSFEVTVIVVGDEAFPGSEVPRTATPRVFGCALHREVFHFEFKFFLPC
jgi:hypothetical protein